MNPAFVIIIILVTFAMFWIVSDLYKPIGNYIYKIYKDAMDVMKGKR